MIINSILPAAAIGVSLLGALLILVFGNKIGPNRREAITMTAAVAKAVLVFSMVPAVLAGNQYEICLWKLTDSLTLSLRTDEAGMVFACVASALWIVTSIYSIGYMRGHGEKNQTGYFAAFAMCMASAIGIAFAANLLTFFIFFEMLTISTYPLVTHYRDAKAKFSGRKYLAYTLISGQLFFVAIVIVYAVYGSCDFVAGGFIPAGSLGQGTMLLLFFMMVLAGMVKSGVMPFHGWLPSAMVAPTPVSALLHAVAVVKAGVFCLLRVVCYVFGPASASWCGGSTVLCWMAVITMMYSSLVALQQDNLKARLAYSTIGQLSYIVLGISLLNTDSITGALFHLAAHACLKITLFMCAGAIYVTYGLAEISNMKGLAKRMPVTSTCFAVASLGIAGMPLMAGFVSKLSLMKGALAAGMPVFLLVLTASALFAIGYLIPVVKIFFGDGEPAISHGHGHDNDHNHNMARIGAGRTDAAWAMLIPIIITTSISILLGSMPSVGPNLYSLANCAAAAIEGGVLLG